MLVDSILQISPAYNPEKGERERKGVGEREVGREVVARGVPVKMVKV